MEKIQIKGEYITLGQLLKYAGWVASGIDAKMLIQDGQVYVNGEVETRRGKKLRTGDQIAYDGHEIEIG